jgi:hypothetical protein
VIIEVDAFWNAKEVLAHELVLSLYAVVYGLAVKKHKASFAGVLV